MPKPQAIDRVKNADNHSDLFIRTPYWTSDVEDHFENWCQASLADAVEALVDRFLGNGVAVSFKMLNGSVCCTLAHQAAKDAGDPYLLTGWSDNAGDALAVAVYKLEVMMMGVWSEPEQPKPTRRR
jgi:hypothetical protein